MCDIYPLSLNNQIGVFMGLESLEKIITGMVSSVQEALSLNRSQRLKKRDYKDLRECYSMIYDALDEYNRVRSDAYAQIDDGKDTLDKVADVIKDAKGDVSKAMGFVEKGRDACNKGLTKVNASLDKETRRISDVLYAVELNAGYTVLSECLGQVAADSMSHDEMLSQFPKYLDDNRLKYAAFYNLRKNTIKKMNEMSLSSPSGSDAVKEF